MKPWELLGSLKVPGGRKTLTLHRRAEEYLIKLDGQLIMGNQSHASEEELAKRACARIANARRPSVLIGGLGMGFTLAAALKKLGPQATVFVAELLPGVVEWNRGPLSHLAGHPLQDPRVTVIEQDVATILRTDLGAYDAILLDVDNGPEGLTQESNGWLYSDAGIDAAAGALRSKGILALWSFKPDPKFVKRLRKAQFDVEEIAVRGREGKRGAHHVVWIASRE